MQRYTETSLYEMKKAKDSKAWQGPFSMHFLKDLHMEACQGIGTCKMTEKNCFEMGYHYIVQTGLNAR